MFKSVKLSGMNINPFDAIGNQWMLITAGDGEKCNTMTASWGGLGVIWNVDAATCYIRPQRYTLEFIDGSEYFSLCFLPEEYRNALALCGRVSGRDCDKIKEAGLTVISGEKAPYFEEAEKVFICRKLYRQQLAPEGFLDTAAASHYEDGDYHYMFIGEIVDCLIKE